MVESDAPSTRGSGFVVRLRKAVERIRDRLQSAFRAVRRAVIKVLRTVGVLIFGVVGVALALALMYVFVNENFPNIPVLVRIVPVWSDHVARWLVTHAESLALLLAIVIFVSERKEQTRHQQFQLLALEPSTGPEIIVLLERLQYTLTRFDIDWWPWQERERLMSRCREILGEDGLRELLRMIGSDAVRGQLDIEHTRRFFAVLGSTEFEPFFDRRQRQAFRTIAHVLLQRADKSAISARDLGHAFDTVWEIYSGDVVDIFAFVTSHLLQVLSNAQLNRLAINSQCVRLILRHPSVQLFPGSGLRPYVTSRWIWQEHSCRTELHERKQGQISKEVESFLKQRELGKHPFGYGDPVSDVLLYESWFDPSGWEDFIRDRGCLVKVPSVADAEIVLHYYGLYQYRQLETTGMPNIFPIQMPQRPPFVGGPVTYERALGYLAHALAASWCQFLASYPVVFQAMPLEVQENLISLLKYSFSVTEIESRIRAHGAGQQASPAKQTGASQKCKAHTEWLLWRIRHLSGTTSLHDDVTPDVIMEKWLSIKLSEAQCMHFVVCPRNQAEWAIVKRLPSLLPLLDSHNFHIKILWPSSSGFIHVPTGISTLHLRWPKDILENILVERLKQASASSKKQREFVTLFDVPPVSRARIDFYALQDRLLEACAPSLARLLCAGRSLIDCHLAKSSPTCKIDVELLGKVVEELETKGP